MNVDQLRKSNSKLEERLSESENKDITNIVVYLRGSQLSDMNQELVRQDILDIVLSAKERGEEMSQAIGTDYKKFCDEVIAEIGPKSKKENLQDVFATVFLSISMLIMIKMIFFTAEVVRTVILNQPINWNVPIQYLDILITVIIVASSWGIVKVVLKDAFDKHDIRTKIIVGVIIVALMVVLGLLYIFHMGTGVLFEINLIAGYCVAAFTYIISKIYDKKRKTK